ncbi:MAG TPA: hypothetical protein VKV80_17685 [Streptosporangiaceae bacterium]|nr:hypothetical protein [Streptosporangiaceae bacterium]
MIERPRLPISVRGSWSGTRLSRWPAAICPAVSSISSSGRRLARTTAAPAIARTTRTTTLTTASILDRRPIVL